MLCAKPDGKVNARQLETGHRPGHCHGRRKGGPSVRLTKIETDKNLLHLPAQKSWRRRATRKNTHFITVYLQLLLYCYSISLIFFGCFVCFVLLLLLLQKFGYSSFCMPLPLWFFLIFFCPFNLFFRIFSEDFSRQVLGAVNENRRRHLGMKCRA